MKESILTSIGTGIQETMAFINWPFLFTFLITAWVINTVIKKRDKRPIAIPTFWRSLMIGVGLALLFWSLMGDHTAKEILRYLCSVWFAMFVMWDGLKKWTKQMKRKLPEL